MATTISTTDVSQYGYKGVELLNRQNATGGGFADELERIQTYKLSDTEKAKLAYAEAQRKGLNAEDVDAFYGLPAGTTAAWVESQGLPALERKDVASTAKNFVASLLEADPVDGEIRYNEDGSWTEYAAVPGSVGVGGTTYNPDGTVRDPAGSRGLLNRVASLASQMEAAENAGLDPHSFAGATRSPGLPEDMDSLLAAADAFRQGWSAPRNAQELLGKLNALGLNTGSDSYATMLGIDTTASRQQAATAAYQATTQQGSSHRLSASA